MWGHLLREEDMPLWVGWREACRDKKLLPRGGCLLPWGPASKRTVNSTKKNPETDKHRPSTGWSAPQFSQSGDRNVALGSPQGPLKSPNVSWDSALNSDWSAMTSLFLAGIGSPGCPLLLPRSGLENEGVSCWLCNPSLKFTVPGGLRSGTSSLTSLAMQIYAGFSLPR